MPIQIAFERSTAGPVVICDHCGKRIDTANNGNALFLEEHCNGQSRIIGPIVFTHKVCNGDFETAHKPAKDQIWAFNDLDVFLVYLTRNLKVDFPNATRRADLLSNIL